MTTKTFLVEIGTEELPPKSLRQLAEAFAANLDNELITANIPHGQVTWFATPRRLAVKIADLHSAQPDSEIVKRGPAVAQAFKADGTPTPAALGWAKGCGIDIKQAQRLTTDKGEWLTYTAQIKGQPVQQLLVDFVNKALAKLPIAKPMRWADKEVQFIRPIHTATLLYGDELIHGTILGIACDRIIRGHRFMGRPEITLAHADEYPQRLEVEGKVQADYYQRKEKIRHDTQVAASTLGYVADMSESLLEEVTSLVEWPVVLTATFEEKFLAVPAEALVYTMKGDQKYFPVYDKQGKLCPYFIFVTNIESKDPQQIIAGNEKVVRPRLADAEFFFKTDLKTPLENLLPRLDTILFQQQLGTLRHKTDRVQALAGWIAERIGANVNQATRAGLLSKCDLMTNMVFEFTDTQGIMGMHYARHDGEDEEVAIALNEQYMPRFAGDALPSSLVACSVAIADKMDTLVGIFGIGQQPKGDKDPFALRRAALGILRILVEKSLSLDLMALAEQAQLLYGDKLTNKHVITDTVDFMLGRFRAWYQDEGYPVDTIQAVLARRPTDPTDFDARMKAVNHFRQLAEASHLAEANKRVSNILAKVDTVMPEHIEASLLKDKPEIILATHIANLQNVLAPLFATGDYQQALTELAQLQEPVNAFFDNVMVMVDDAAIRTNRLALLNQLRQLFLHVADISLLQS